MCRVEPLRCFTTCSWLPIRCFISPTWLTRPTTRPPSRRPFKGVHDLLQCLLVEAAEALIDEQRFNVNTAGFLLHHVREAQGQRQRGHEGFSAGEGRGVAAAAGPLVHDFQPQPGFGVPGCLGVRVLQGVAAVAHGDEPFRRGNGDLFEPGRQDVAFRLMR